MHILFVENHARFARVTVQQFLSTHRVTIAASIASARQALAQSAFDVVMVDYDLDDGKGIEIVQMLQAQVPRPAIIAVSSHQVGNDALVAAGADAVCSKMQFSNIEKVIIRLLDENN